MNNFWSRVWVIGSLLAMAACSDDAESLSPGASNGLRITASLYAMHSRAAGGEIMSNDNGGFREGDIVGLFSEGGNLEEGSDGKLLNIPMKFESSSDGNYVFVNEDINVNTNLIGRTYVYYPYREGIEKEGASIVDDNGRVYDVLVARGTFGVPYAFTHAFCRLKITCGEGFDRANGQRITVRLNRGADKIRIIENIYPGNTEWDGGPMKFKNNELFGEKRDFEVWESGGVWHVILPCFEYWENKITVDYVTIKDNEGKEHKLYLPHDVFEINGADGKPEHEPTGYLKKDHVFPITIRMENLVPTVRGGTILSWGDDEHITINREYGINESKDFEDWVEKYNAFITRYSAGERPGADDIANEGHEFHGLLNYGKYTNRKWNFYIAADLDLSGLSGARSVVITELRDTVSGGNHTLENISLEGTGERARTGFVGTLGEGGCIQDLKLSSLHVNNSASTGGTSGTLVTSMTGGMVTNCSVLGISMHCAAGVSTGAFAGEMTGGTVEYCRFQGAIMGGTSTATGEYAVILGTDASGGTLIGVDAKNVIVMN